jgi:hypothetical protein
LNRPALPRSSGGLRGLTILALVAAPVPAQAHVKWFAPYIVGAPPQPIGVTLTNVWFWTGIALVLVFFLASRAIEKSSAGETILRGMDRITDLSGSASTTSCAWSLPPSSWRSSPSAAST